jgi:hypothetical protein
MYRPSSSVRSFYVILTQIGMDQQTLSTLISGYRRDLDEICGLLGNYTASCGNYL